jgi:hypothetical protein
VKERDYLEELGIDGRIILDWHMNNLVHKCVHFTHFIQNWKEWWDVMNTVTCPEILYKARNF